MTAPMTPLPRDIAADVAGIESDRWYLISEIIRLDQDANSPARAARLREIIEAARPLVEAWGKIMTAAGAVPDADALYDFATGFQAASDALFELPA